MASNECTAYVGKLDYGATEDDINDLFCHYGEIAQIKIPVDRENQNKPKGFAFVQFTTKEAADKAVECCHGKCINNREIVVSIAKPRKTYSDGGSGGGGYQQQQYGGGVYQQQAYNNGGGNYQQQQYGNGGGHYHQQQQQPYGGSGGGGNYQNYGAY